MIEKDCIIRPIEEKDYPALRRFLYQAIFVPPGTNPPPKEVVDLPELQLYIANYGKRKGDIGYTATIDDLVVGMAWCRLMNDYGHVDEHTPSLAISLVENYRNKGIGTQLIRTLLHQLEKEGYTQVSLSVQKANPAYHLYCRLGFTVVRETEEEYIMVCKLTE